MINRVEKFIKIHMTNSDMLEMTSIFSVFSVHFICIGSKYVMIS